MKKNIILIVSLILMGSILFMNGCNIGLNEKKEGVVYDYKLNSLIIDFNNVEEKNLIADISNNEFKRYFKNELSLLESEVNNVEAIKIDVIYSYNGVVIELDFVNNLTYLDKNNTLSSLKSKLENKWYTENVYYDSIVAGN